MMGPKELIPAGWVQKPCTFLLPLDSASAELCGECAGEFSWWKRSRRHCTFCGHVFHQHLCTRKILVQGEFFKQIICSRCHYYKTTAKHKLQSGEEFECIGPCDGGGCTVTVSLCEETAEVVMNWKSKGLKETADLATVEVRKGFSHVHHHETGGGNYEPLRSFSLFLKDGLGELCAYHLKASSALICQLWVEGLKAAGYVYQKMLEQEQAAQHYSHKNIKIPSSGWFSKPYLPSPPSPAMSSPPFSEEWEDLSTACPPFSDEWEDLSSQDAADTSPFSPRGGLVSSARYPTTMTSPSSGYQSDLSLSFCSSIAPPPRQALTVHSFNFSRATPSRKPSSLSSTPHTSSLGKQSGTHSLPPTPGITWD